MPIRVDVHYLVLIYPSHQHHNHHHYDARVVHTTVSQRRTCAMSSSLTPKAHQVLNSLDILRMIFDYVDERSAAQCIRVCKVWFEPAADLLWCELRGFVPVLKLLPRFNVKPVCMTVSLLFIFFCAKLNLSLGALRTPYHCHYRRLVSL